jgi:hypothetical protein
MSPWFQRLQRHAIFPILLYLPLSQALRDNFYPVSHFPMYSNPTSKPLKIHSLTDEEGKLLAVLTHSGVTPSHMSKMYGGFLKEKINQERKLAAKEGRSVKPEEDFFQAAAVEVLTVLRKQSLKRPAARQLRQSIQLRESQVSVGAGAFEEKMEVLGSLPAMEGQPG